MIGAEDGERGWQAAVTEQLTEVVRAGRKKMGRARARAREEEVEGRNGKGKIGEKGRGSTGGTGCRRAALGALLGEH